MSRTIHVIVTSRYGDDEYGLQFTAGDWDEEREPTIADVDYAWIREAEHAMMDYEREHGYIMGQERHWVFVAEDFEALAALAEAEA